MVGVTTLPSRPMTVEDLDELREAEDGRRYELLDGSLIVTPAPRPLHQSIAFALAMVLEGARPADLQVFVAPVDVRIEQAAVLQPDVVVVPRSQVGEHFIRHPVLVVEVLSPATRDIDLTLKKARYERAGCPSYWVVDPDGPTLTAWDLREQRYEQVAHATTGDVLTLARPFGVTVRLSGLLT